MMEIEKITLKQLLQYFDQEIEPQAAIQIVVGEEEWDLATELYIASELLTPFMDYYIQEMGYEESYFDHKPLLRVSISKERD